MGRWKPPPPASSPYITPAGFAALQDELQQLWVRRADVVKALSAAAAEGDRSENAEYIYRKKELGGIDYRIRYLQKRLPKLNVVKDSPKPGQVFFGAWVTVEDEEGHDVEYRIVGPDETEAATAYISMDAPMAKAMLKKIVDDEFSLNLAGGTKTFVVKAIRYES
ncbi:MAG: transcription elongation factor GreB [Gammaproteobacteria bacterium]